MEIPNSDSISPHPDRLPISPSLESIVDAPQAPGPVAGVVTPRALRISLLSIVLGVAASFVAVALLLVINSITNLSFYGRFSVEPVSPAGNALGVWVIGIPVIGAIIIGFMARYGSQAIRGHGIPEAMEQVLLNRSRIPARITLLKPLSAAISIGTGGPFGAEGPIIATGGALGSLLGQMLHVTAAERKTLLAAGAAAGMSATFGSPVSAVLLAIELLLFEFRARSIIPVALASVSAAGMRIMLEGSEPVFPMPHVDAPSLIALAFYIALGALTGLAAALVTRLVYAIEDGFEKLPIHWMWWPALGAIAVGIVGYFAPRTFGVGYNNISDVLSDKLSTQVVLVLCVMKLVSWSISLGSGTSGGTLAPLFTIGGGLGYALSAAVILIAPNVGIDVRVAALVGMAAMFAGASRAVLASVVFAFETTLQPMGLLPLLGGCSSAYLVSLLVMRNSIMTERIARRGVRPPAEYVADSFNLVLVRQIACPQVVALHAGDRIAEVRAWINSGENGSTHQGFPILNAQNELVGVLTRRDIQSTDGDDLTCFDLIRLPPRFVYEDATVRQAAEHMVNHGIGRLPVVSRTTPPRVVGMMTRSDILSCLRRDIEEDRPEAPTVQFPRFRRSVLQRT